MRQAYARDRPARAQRHTRSALRASDAAHGRAPRAARVYRPPARGSIQLWKNPFPPRHPDTHTQLAHTRPYSSDLTGSSACGGGFASGASAGIGSILLVSVAAALSLHMATCCCLKAARALFETTLDGGSCSTAAVRLSRSCASQAASAWPTAAAVGSLNPSAGLRLAWYCSSVVSRCARSAAASTGFARLALGSFVALMLSTRCEHAEGGSSVAAAAVASGRARARRAAPINAERCELSLHVVSRKAFYLFGTPVLVPQFSATTRAAATTAGSLRRQHEGRDQGAAGDDDRRDPRDHARRVEPQRQHQVAQPVPRSLRQHPQRRRAISDAGHTLRPRRKVASQRRRRGGFTDRWRASVARPARVPRSRVPPTSS